MFRIMKLLFFVTSLMKTPAGSAQFATIVAGGKNWSESVKTDETNFYNGDIVEVILCFFKANF